MKPLSMILLAISVLVTVALLGAFSAQQASAQACGPGDHWVDTCPAGTDDMDPTEALVGLDTVGDCEVDQNLILMGPTSVERSEGQGAVVPHSIDTEIVSMELTGGGITLRAGDLSGAPLLPESLGEIEEQAGNAALADSFFDVYFEILLPNGHPLNPLPMDLPLYNATALRVETDEHEGIDRVPPDAEYLHPDPLCLPLFLPASLGGGPAGVNLVSAKHDTHLAVGGIAEDVDAPVAPRTDAGDSGSTTPLYAALAGLAMAAVAVVATGGWYARRRSLR